MISTDNHHFFESHELEDIVEYYSEKGKWKKALIAVDTALEYYSFNTDFHIHKTNLLISLEKYHEALRILNDIEPIIPLQFELHLYKGDCLMFLEKYPESLKSYKKALDLAGSIEEKENVYLDLAFVYQSIDKYDKSFECILKSIRLNYHHEEAISELGSFIEFHRYYDKGINILNEIIEHNPYCFQAWYYLGICYRELEDLENSLKAFDYAIVINNEFEPALIEQARTMTFIGRWEEGIQLFEKALRVTGSNDEIFTELGNIYLNKHDLQKARSYYDKAIKCSLSTDFTDELYFKIGQCYVREEEWLKAKKCFKKAYDKYKDAIYLKGLANVEEKLEEFENAIYYYEEAIEMDPYNETIWEDYSNCLYNCEMVEDAVSVLESALFVITDSAKLRYLLSAYLYKGGKKKQAQFEFEKALNMDFLNHELYINTFPHLKKEESVRTLIEQFKNK
jgi:tetratricopeptide (TPR) repeat protein